MTFFIPKSFTTLFAKALRWGILTENSVEDGLLFCDCFNLSKILKPLHIPQGQCFE
jgi:hypothetical protein